MIKTFSKKIESGKEQRPDIIIPFTTLQKSLIFVSIAGFLLGPAMILYYWTSLPANVPRYFGFSGKADAWGGKGSLLILPIINIPMLILLIGLSLTPQSYNYPIRITPENARLQ
jgi:uncharacterized membrane protein